MRKLAWPDDERLKLANRCLLAIIILVNAYVLIMPLLPRLDYEVKQHVTKPVKANDNAIKNLDRSRNHLVLPTIQLDEPVYDGVSPSTVHKGIWRRPATSTPDKGSNTVLVGHRFTYAGTAVFYNLDKLQAGDDVYLVYGQKIYHYQVSGSSIVPPTDTAVEAPTQEPRLTIYTCTPLVTAKYRLIYTTELKEVL